MSTNDGQQQPPWGTNPPQMPPWMQQPQEPQPPASAPLPPTWAQHPPQPPRQDAWQQPRSQSLPPQPNWQGQQGYQSQQPPYGYPQPQMQQQTPQAPQKKKKRTGCIIGVVALVVILGLCGIAQAASKAGSQPSGNTANAIATKAPASTPVFSGMTPIPTYPPTVTPKPTQAPSWRTTKTFSGNGTKKSDTFSVPDTWKLVWKCDPTSFGGYTYNLIVSVTATDGSMGDPVAVNTICSATNTHDTTTEHAGGTVYLDVSSEGSWTIQVQELQ